MIDKYSDYEGYDDITEAPIDLNLDGIQYVMEEHNRKYKKLIDDLIENSVKHIIEQIRINKNSNITFNQVQFISNEITKTMNKYKIITKKIREAIIDKVGKRIMDKKI